MSTLVFNEKYQVYHRQSGTDRDRIPEVLRTYKNLSIGPQSRVLDLGGNIGLFSFFFTKQAELVVVFEPEKENFEILSKNLSDRTNLLGFNGAVTLRKYDTIDFYKSTGKSSGNHSVRPIRGRKLIQVNNYYFPSILSAYRPTVIKMDVEGAEYELLVTELPQCVKEIIIEFHFTKKGDAEKCYDRIKGLNEQGFKQVQRAKIDPDLRHTISHLRR
ncbi:MAG: FkbM family methyltransferase [Candidatus Thorarchaeota archaeon]|nr:FkbM family methyltransferase [Candidatus Thorarchaeota archaeon]